MHRRTTSTTRRAMVGLALAAAATAGTASPAAAGERPQVDQFARPSDTAIVSWLERDAGDAVGRPGNVTVGGLIVERLYGVTDVYGVLTDWQCEEGQRPDGVGDERCRPLASYEFVDRDAQLTVDLRSGSARLSGDLALLDLEQVRDEVVVPVDLTWTSDGQPVRTSEHDRVLSETFKLQVNLRSVTWGGLQVDGSVAGLALGDEPGDVTEEQLWSDEDRFLFWERGTAEPPDDGDGQG